MSASYKASSETRACLAAIMARSAPAASVHEIVTDSNRLVVWSRHIKNAGERIHSVAMSERALKALEKRAQSYALAAQGVARKYGLDVRPSDDIRGPGLIVTGRGVPSTLFAGKGMGI